LRYLNWRARYQKPGAAVFGGPARGLAFLTTNLSSAFSKQCKSFPKGCEGERE
jgi:hypothetical protein